MSRLTRIVVVVLICAVSFVSCMAHTLNQATS